jgi:FkbM family methyltransferase
VAYLRLPWREDVCCIRIGKTTRAVFMARSIRGSALGSQAKRGTVAALVCSSLCEDFPLATPLLTRSIASLTRTVQRAHPSAPVRGLSRATAWLAAHLPPYEGPVRLNSGAVAHVNSRRGADSTLLFTGDYQTALTHVLRTHTPPGAHCLDIGANLGFFTITLAMAAGMTGRVTGFEANPRMAARARANIALTAQTGRAAPMSLEEKAVDVVSGEVRFHVSDSDGKSSLLSGQAGQVLETITVPAVSVDDYMAASGWPRLDVIKCDIEGYDVIALAGAAETIRRFRPFICFEYHATSNVRAALHLLDVLLNAGYSLNMLTMRGARLPFKPESLAAGAHIDVLAEPENR